MYQDIYMYITIHLKTLEYNIHMSTKIQYPHVHHSSMSTCTPEFDIRWRRMVVEMTKNGGWDGRDRWVKHNREQSIMPHMRKVCDVNCISTVGWWVFHIVFANVSTIFYVSTVATLKSITSLPLMLLSYNVTITPSSEDTSWHILKDRLRNIDNNYMQVLLKK